jgi:hypothetical protein
MDYNIGFVDTRLYCLTYEAAPWVPSQTFTVWHAAQCSLLFHFDMGDGACSLFQGLEIAIRSFFTVLKQGAEKFLFDISQLMLDISSALFKKVLEVVSICLKRHSTLKKHICCVSRCYMKSPYSSQGKQITQL